MRNLLHVAACALMALALSGCVSYDYQGESAEPTTALTVFTDSAKIAAPYRVLGTATVSGNYEEVTRDRMIAKLRSEGEKCGANAILIVEQQVIPGKKTTTRATGFNTAFSYDDTNRSWSQIYQDVNGNYGKAFDKSAGTEEVVTYRRVIRAEFLRYQDSVAPAQAEPQSKK